MNSVVHFDYLHESVTKVKEAGGRVIGEPMDIPGIGPCASFTDPEGRQRPCSGRSRENGTRKR